MRPLRPRHPLSPGPWSPVSSSIHNVIVLLGERGAPPHCLCPKYPVHYVKSLRVHFLISTVSVQNSIIHPSLSRSLNRRLPALKCRVMAVKQIHCSKVHRNNSWEIFPKLLNKAQTYYFTKKVWKINISSHCYRGCDDPEYSASEGGGAMSHGWVEWTLLRTLRKGIEPPYAAP